MYTQKQFKPSPEMVQAAKNVFIAMAYTETIRPIVEGYQKKVLNFFQFKNNGELKRLSKRFPEIKERVILNPKESYLLDDEDFKIYLAECNIEREKAGLKVDNPDFCPLLVAESLERDAKRCLVETMETITGIETSILTGHLEEYKKVVDLTLRLLAPYCKNIKI